MSKEISTSKFSEIKRRYEVQADNHKELGDYVNMCYIIIGRNYKKEDIRRAFLKLVNRDEYDFSERHELLDYLCQITLKQN
jgi:hypothetical protein